MLGITFFHMRALQACIFFLGILAAYATYKNRVLSYVGVYAAAIWLFGIKMYEYVGSGRLPMDISAICYFLFGACTILPVRPLKVAAAHLGTLCGLVYGIVMIAMPHTFYQRDPDEFLRFYGMVNHAMLFFGGFAMFVHVRFKKTDFFWTLCLLTLIIGYTEICVQCGVAAGTAMFPSIINGSFVFDELTWLSPTWWYYPVYYALLATLFALWLKLTYIINRRAVPESRKAGFFAL